MKGPEIARKFVKDTAGFGLASGVERRCVFVAPIADNLSGFCIDRTSSATENILRPFAFPLAFGKSDVILDSNFPMRLTRFDPKGRDCMARVHALTRQHIIPWLSVRQTLKDLLSHTPVPEKVHKYGRSSGPLLVDFVKLLCLVERFDEASKLIDDVCQEFARYGQGSIAADDHEKLLVLRSQVVEACDEDRAKFWREARKATISALQIDRSFLSEAL